jgi:hypothetical protein
MTAVFGLSGCTLLCLAVIASSLRLGRRTVRIRYAIVAAAAILLFVPVGGIPVVAYVRGVTGDLSAATLALATGALVSPIEPRERNALLWAVAAGSLFLYPFALGWTPFDPYALGYGSIPFITALLIVTLAAWRAGLKVLVLVVVIGGLAYLAGAYESRNLWDYLVDPLAGIYAVVRLALELVRRGAGSKLAA